MTTSKFIIDVGSLLVLKPKNQCRKSMGLAPYTQDRRRLVSAAIDDVGYQLCKESIPGNIGSVGFPDGIRNPTP